MGLIKKHKIKSTSILTIINKKNSNKKVSFEAILYRNANMTVPIMSSIAALLVLAQNII